MCNSVISAFKNLFVQTWEDMPIAEWRPALAFWPLLWYADVVHVVAGDPRQGLAS